MLMKYTYEARVFGVISVTAESPAEAEAMIKAAWDATTIPLVDGIQELEVALDDAEFDLAEIDGEPVE